MKFKRIFQKNNSKGDIFFFTDQKVCDVCKKPLDKKYAVIKECWSRSEKIGEEIKIICRDCTKKHGAEFSSLYDVVNTKLVFVSNIIPENSIPYIPVPPNLSNRKDMYSFDIRVIKDIEGEEVIDNTVYAGRLQSDYDPDLLLKRDEKLKELTLEKNNVSSEEEAVALLDDLKKGNEQGVIEAENKDTKLLGEQKW